MKRLVKISTGLAFGIIMGFYLPQIVGSSKLPSPFLLSEEINSQLPKKVNEGVYVMKTKVKFGEFTYIYSVDMDQAKFDSFILATKKSTLERTCKGGYITRLLTENKMNVSFLYYDTHERKLGELTIGPEDCKT